MDHPYVDMMRRSSVAQELGASVAVLLRRAVLREFSEPQLRGFYDNTAAGCRAQLQAMYRQAIDDYIERMTAGSAGIAIENLDQWLTDLLLIRTGLALIRTVEENSDACRVSG